MITKELIVGSNGSGKTKYIINELIPDLKEYLIFDFFNEYNGLENKNGKVVSREQIIVSDLKKGIIAKINETSIDATIILDNANLFYFPSKIDSTGINWLFYALKERSAIIVFQSLSLVIRTNIEDHFDRIVLFKTNDTLSSVLDLRERIAGKKITLKKIMN